MLRIGATAPDFTATLDSGSPFRLHEWLRKGRLVLYFYPKDFTRG